LTSDHLIIDDARDYLPLFQIDRVSGPYGVRPKNGTVTPPERLPRLNPP
jgi:hypothetical protein